MPCYKAQTRRTAYKPFWNQIQGGDPLQQIAEAQSGPYASEKDCNIACLSGACCDGTSCFDMPACKCIGAGYVFQGIGTSCDSVTGYGSVVVTVSGSDYFEQARLFSGMIFYGARTVGVAGAAMSGTHVLEQDGLSWKKTFPSVWGCEASIEFAIGGTTFSPVKQVTLRVPFARYFAPLGEEMFKEFGDLSCSAPYQFTAGAGCGANFPASHQIFVPPTGYSERVATSWGSKAISIVSISTTPLENPLP